MHKLKKGKINKCTWRNNHEQNEKILQEENDKPVIKDNIPQCK